MMHIIIHNLCTSIILALCPSTQDATTADSAKCKGKVQGLFEVQRPLLFPPPHQFLVLLVCYCACAEILAPSTSELVVG